MVKTVDELIDLHVGVPACVLGSGPNLVSDFEKRPEGSLLIAVNWRPIPWLREQGLEPDYVVYNDPNEGNHMRYMQDLIGKRVSCLRERSDWEVKGRLWNGGFSSTVAVHLALHMGCDPVVLMGMDCYRGDRPYFDSPEGEDHKLLHVPDENHIRAWSPALNRLPNVDRVKVVSGLLTELFGEYTTGLTAEG